MTEVGTLEKTNAIIREAYTKKEGEVDLTEEYKNLIRECEGVIELCENAHMSNALYAPVFILAEAKKVIDHADRIFCYVNVDWRPVWAIRAFDQGKCRRSPGVISAWLRSCRSACRRESSRLILPTEARTVASMSRWNSGLSAWISALVSSIES